MRLFVILSLLLVGCATTHPPLRIRDTPEDFAALGLTDTVEPREDGRRSRAGTDDYEWWYLDGVAADGTVVVVVFSDNWLPGGHRREVTLDITQPGQATRRTAFATDDAGSFATDRADVRIGKSRFEGNLERYTIHVDASDAQGLGCDLELLRRVPSYRPGTGVMASGDDYFAWVVPVPEGALSGTLSIDGQRSTFTGTGYHDHNWGNAPPWSLMRNWWWGRGEVNGKTVVMSEMRPAKGRGDKAMSLLLVAGVDGIVAKLHGDQTALIETTATPGNALNTDQTFSAWVTLQSRDANARFERHGVPTTSLDLLSGSPGIVRFFARLAGRSPWYTRWRSDVTLEVGGQLTKGTGTIEFMDFE